MDAKSVLVVGGGGREHALAWKLSQSQHVGKVFLAPGNGSANSDTKFENIDVDVKNHGKVIEWCKRHEINLVVVGPEEPLASGLADSLNEAGVTCFGPSAAASRIESSKEFAKHFMCANRVPTARWESFTDVDNACQHIETAPYDALVVKVSGLAAGKGVFVCQTKQEACEAVKEIIEKKKFGAAGMITIVEELLLGEELSVLAFTDGETVKIMPPSQDHKRLEDGDHGPNTGGMGAYCPCALVTC